MPTNNLRMWESPWKRGEVSAAQHCKQHSPSGSNCWRGTSYLQLLKKLQNPNILTEVKEYPNKNPIHVHLEHKWERPPRHPTPPAPWDTHLVQNRTLRTLRHEWEFWALISKPSTALGFSWCSALMTGKIATQFVVFSSQLKYAVEFLLSAVAANLPSYAEL